MLDYHSLTFSPELRAERIAKAESLFGRSVLKRILCFALYLLGANRRAIARDLAISVESLKTTLRVLHRDGVAEFEGRRRAASTFLVLSTARLKIAVREEPDSVVTECGENECVRIRRDNTVQLQTFILSLVNSGLISAKAAGDILHLSSACVRDLAKQLEQGDVGALLDKRQGQIQQYRMSPKTTALLIQQFAAHAVTGRSTSSIVLADEVNVPDTSWACPVELHCNTLKKLKNLREPC